MSHKMLVVGPAWVGDMVMAQSLFKLLKQCDPTVTIDVLAPAWTFSLLSRMPEVSQALLLPFRHGELKLSARYQFAKKLKANHYQQALVLPHSFKSALIPWFARIPIRTGWLGEYRYYVLNDIRHLNKKRYPLMIEQFMALGLRAESPLPAIYPYPEFEVLAAAQSAIVTKRGKPILALCAGAEYGPAKRWPLEYFAEIANAKLKEGWDVWLFGSQKDRPITEKIMALTHHRCENIAGRTGLEQTIDLLSLVTGMVTNDSGLMHIAAALKKPLVALYGSTSPAFTPPLSKRATVLKLSLDCQPCFERHCPLSHHRCMRDLSPERVLQAILQWRI